MVCIVLLVLLMSQVCCEMNLDDLWTSWKSEFNKQYNSSSKEAYRRAVWEKKVLTVKKHNEEYAQGRHTFTMGTNHLSDMTVDEVNARLNGLKVKNVPDHDKKNILTFSSDFTPPTNVDWNEQGFVSAVQDQGMCGSCWAFSAAGALEAQMKNTIGQLVPLSVQNLIDCSYKYGNNGCRGGYMSKAFNYVINNGGIDSEEFYPYEKTERRCRYSPRESAGYCSGFYSIPHFNETALLHAVAKIGPVSVGINAGLETFVSYSTGIYSDNDCNPWKISHAVLVVGYGTTSNNQKYWLIKNSWGTGWGDNGYMRMARDKRQCGIPTDGTLPIVNLNQHF